VPPMFPDSGGHHGQFGDGRLLRRGQRRTCSPRRRHELVRGRSGQDPEETKRSRFRWADFLLRSAERGCELRGTRDDVTRGPEGRRRSPRPAICVETCMRQAMWRRYVKIRPYGSFLQKTHRATPVSHSENSILQPSALSQNVVFETRRGELGPGPESRARIGIRRFTSWIPPTEYIRLR